MASALDTARKTIEARINTLWAAGLNTTIAWENKKTDPPNTGSWIKVNIVWGDTELSTKNGRNTTTGLVMITVFSPSNTPGTGLLHTTADAVRDMLNRIEVSGVRFGTPSGPMPGAGTDESRWLERVVSTPFTVDEIVT